jgi:hypothetical protein
MPATRHLTTAGCEQEVVMKKFIAYTLIAGLAVSPGGTIASGLFGVSIAAAESPTTGRSASGTPPADGGWPRQYSTSSGARLTLYEPQVDSWTDQKHIVMYLAVSHIATGAQKASLGTIRVESDTKVSVPERLVQFSTFTITAVSFPAIDRDETTRIVAEISGAVPLNERVIGLDRVMAAVNESHISPKNIDGVKADPPVVFYSEKPAVLVNLDGEPIWSAIAGNDLRFAVNTNWDLFEYPPSKTYYLRIDTLWMKAPAVDGPWSVEATLPASFSKLPDDDNWKDVTASLATRSATASPPAVFISKSPAELILLTGAPRYAPVPGTRLQWVSNTENDVFRLGTDGLIYFLVSGRWFSSTSFSGPWTFATVNLPDDFKRLPIEHPRSRVLASVPGTRQAIEAVMLAQIPETARVSRREIKAPEVFYQGEPQFAAIEETNGVDRALNTDKDILKVGDLYYMCFEGVWFVSRAANGPWTLADQIPQQIYDIPISSPAYDVTHVTVEDYDDDWVTYASAAAYTGMMVAWGCAVWGTGYYYPPYLWGAGLYPVYYPRYPSYGYGARYNPWTGAYTRGGVAYGPYGGAGYAARYNPSTGTYSRGAAAWGPGGARGAAQAWNPRTGTYAQTRQGRNVYGSWGSTAVARGDHWATTSRVSNRATGNTTRVTQGSGGGTAVNRSGGRVDGAIGRTGSGNVYAGSDGNVYRNQGGGWQKYENGGWSSAERPVGTAGQIGSGARGDLSRDSSSSTLNQLNRDRAARSEATQRTRDLSTVRSTSGSSRASSYRPSGGGFRSGGGGGRARGGRR